MAMQIPHPADLHVHASNGLRALHVSAAERGQGARVVSISSTFGAFPASDLVQSGDEVVAINGDVVFDLPFEAVKARIRYNAALHYSGQAHMFREFHSTDAEVVFRPQMWRADRVKWAQVCFH